MKLIKQVFLVATVIVAYFVGVEIKIIYNSHYWPDDFKESFMDDCEASIGEEGGLFFPTYCSCVADDLQAHGVITPEYNKIFSSEEEAIKRNRERFQDYMDSYEGKLMTVTCTQSGVKEWN